MNAVGAAGDDGNSDDEAAAGADAVADAGADYAADMRVEVTLTTVAGAECDQVDLPAGATVGEAVAASRFAAEDALAYAVHGQVAGSEYALREGDRVDLLRPLLVDPKDARRQRANTQSDARPSHAHGAGGSFPNSESE